MSNQRPAENASLDARALTAVVTGLRRVLRTSIRTDYPWEALPMAQVELLMTVSEHQPARIGELAARLRLAPNTVSGLVQALVEAGLASRRTNPDDRRASLVALTDTGAELLDGWDRAHQERIDAALTGLPPHEREAIHAAIPALAAFVEQLRSTADQPPPPTPCCGGR
ncbi:MAG: MarR family transcriptional regulator [Pseudonocardia sp.]|uniref:MarR family winged helix-turn-helix transcriptional regulator n=1 Tax=unclassified Pseudonocardia TaxID=2619320 RepID=UPI00086F9536|nr:MULTISPECIES: MarR family transcriptional regulator [unclassified Pseudonocardia]MBN9109759.1 MarR family transcriptional regulator [Pseudonocardia sp.]ODU26739.1 MAG: MarR family transcriptional regulator [Pseudonocardia sp. SCN 72-51]ODV09168.1 MAG: MarR family transcriptional regulator [Pseudonocardia sp. SCN 73-27]